mmetsp:Transcript_64861/g.183063  ORF Transcript_64861/g.183063 Transcript_64861/m.183063 type:complete len:302 (+) Transcript_64861:374-1279(+)
MFLADGWLWKLLGPRSADWGVRRLVRRGRLCGHDSMDRCRVPGWPQTCEACHHPGPLQGEPRPPHADHPRGSALCHARALPGARRCGLRRLLCEAHAREGASEAVGLPWLLGRSAFGSGHAGGFSGDQHRVPRETCSGRGFLRRCRGLDYGQQTRCCKRREPGRRPQPAGWRGLRADTAACRGAGQGLCMVHVLWARRAGWCPGCMWVGCFARCTSGQRGGVEPRAPGPRLHAPLRPRLCGRRRGRRGRLEEAAVPAQAGGRRAGRRGASGGWRGCDRDLLRPAGARLGLGASSGKARESG